MGSIEAAPEVLGRRVTPEMAVGVLRAVEDCGDGDLEARAYQVCSELGANESIDAPHLTLAEARQSLTDYFATQDREAKPKVLALAERKQEQLDQLADEAPLLWGEQAREHRVYVENFKRASRPRGDHTAGPIKSLIHGMPRTRSRGAGRPRGARRTTQAGSSSDSSEGESEPPEYRHADSAPHLLTGLNRSTCNELLRIGGAL